MRRDVRACGIYFITNTATGRIYVGSSRNCPRRFSEHRSRLRRGVHHNAKLQATWLKHGEAAFDFKMVCTVLSADSLELVEQGFIDEYQAVRMGYNLAPTAGNTAGWVAGPETRKRMSEAAKRRDHSAQVQAMAARNRGQKRPEHVLQAMREGKKNSPITQKTREQMAVSARNRSRYDDAARAGMAAMRDQGRTWRDIAKSYGLTGHAAVMVYVKEWKARNGNTP